MSYDPGCFEKGWEFILAGERYREMDLEKVPIKEQALVCGLFKQATSGDITFEYADRVGPIFESCRAWEELKGLSKPEAMEKYVKKCNEVFEAYK